MVLLAPDYHPWPDSFQEKPEIRRTAEDINPRIELVHPTLWRVVLDTSNKAEVVLTQVWTKEELFELSWNLEWVLTWIEKQEFIKKLRELPDYEWSKVQEAIEKWTIEIKKIPGREWYAIYESRTWNLVYITRLDWTRYTNIDRYREKEMLSDIFKAGYIRQWYLEIELDENSWLWKLYWSSWEEIPIFSDEYSIATLNAINTMWDFIDFIEEEAKKRERK